MDIYEFIDLLESNNNSKRITNAFNSLNIEDRIDVLEMLSTEGKTALIKKIRNQAVKDFWTHEQELIRNGMSTREWTPDQIESIMNISEKTGNASINGDVAYDIAGKSYYGHHMKSVAEYPEYAGDWRNIQALDYSEHYNGAHGGRTKILCC